MITRKLSSPHICLRCQRSLAKRSFQLRSAQFLSGRRRYSEQAAPDANRTEDVDSENAEDPKAEDKYVSENPGNKLRGYRGMFRREDLEELRGATALGDQAKVIVLRDSILTKYSYERKKPDIIQPEHIDILGTLEEERGLVGEDEVTKNINGFRPREADAIQDWEELDRLTQALQQSFTTSQLAAYMKNFKDKQDLDKPPEIWKANNPQSAITRITAWLPGISPNEQNFDNDPLREYYLTSHTPKQVLALRILRECWGLEIPELEEGIGQFEIRLRRGDLDLLLLGGPKSPLNTIHSTYLQFEEERLEAYKSRSTIRVTTTSAKKYAIVDAVQKAVLGIQRGRINVVQALMPAAFPGPNKVERFMETYFDDTSLEALGQLTETKIIHLHQNNTHILEISCIEPNSDAQSSRIDTVRRLILNYDYSASNIEQDLAIKQTDHRSALIEYTQTQGLNWRQKLQSWNRYTAPIPKKVPGVGEPPSRPFLSPIIESSKGSNPAPEVKDEEKEDAPVYWSKKHFTNTSALMGNIIFSHPQNLHFEPNSTPENTPNLDQTFSTKLPNLSRVLSKALLQKKNHKPVQRMIITFQPDPFLLKPKKGRFQTAAPIGIDGVSAFPNLQMTFDVNSLTKESTLLEVKAIVHEKRTDVMQPDNAVDIRFQQQRTSRLIRRFLKPIRTFLAQSQLNISGSKKIDVPPSIVLPISQHLCRDGEFPAGKGKKADPAKKKMAQVKAEADQADETAEQADVKNSADKMAPAAPVENEDSTNQADTSISAAQAGDETSPAQSDKKNSKDQPDDKLPSDVRNVQYLFTSLEIHSTLNFFWQDFCVSYTSIEAGKAYSRRSELKLRPIKSSSQIATEEDFIQAAYKLADMLGDGSGEHVNFDGVKVINSRLNTGMRKGDQRTKNYFAAIARKQMTRGDKGKDAGKPRLLFDYFAGRFKFNANEEAGGQAEGRRGGFLNWEESEEMLDGGSDDRGMEAGLMEEREVNDDGLREGGWHREG